MVDDRHILESVQRNSGDITVAGRVNVKSYTCLSLEFQQFARRIQRQLCRHECIDNAALISLEWHECEIVVGEFLVGRPFAHCWNRVGGNDIDLTSELVNGGFPASLTYFEVFSGTLDELRGGCPEPEDPEDEIDFFLWVWRRKASPGRFSTEKNFALRLMRSDQELEEWLSYCKQVSGFRGVRGEG